MNSNPTIQNTGTLAWTGTTSRAADIRGHTNFGWTFNVLADLAADAVFAVEGADTSAVDDCLPGAFAPVTHIAVCGNDNVGDPVLITIPAGTPAGTLCGGTIPCRAGAFLRLVSSAGQTADVEAVLIRQGPTGFGQINDPRV